MSRRDVLGGLFVILFVCFSIIGTVPAQNGAFSLISPVTEFCVNDASGYQGTNILVPVEITNAQNGPIISIILDILYDTSVVNVVDVRRGNLTSTWDSPPFNNFAWGTRVSIVYDGVTEHGIQNETNGSVILLNFSLVGTPGSTSGMNLSNIQLSDTGYNVGTAPAKNGTLVITEETPENPVSVNETTTFNASNPTDYEETTSVNYTAGDSGDDGINTSTTVNTTPQFFDILKNWLDWWV